MPSIDRPVCNNSLIKVSNGIVLYGVKETAYQNRIHTHDSMHSVMSAKLNSH